MSELEVSPAPRFRSHLGWALLSSVMAAAWALWWPEPVKVADAAELLAATAMTREPALGARPEAVATLRESLADPFFPITAPAAESSALPASGASWADSMPAAAAALPPPAPPRIAGVFTGPEGEKSVFLNDGAQLLPAKPGLVLSSGYQLEAIGLRELRLRHPAASEPLMLPMPAAPLAGTLP